MFPTTTPPSGPLQATARPITAPARAGPRGAALNLSTPAQPRESAQDDDFGYPAYGSAGAQRFLDRLEDETGSGSGSPATNLNRQDRAGSGVAFDYSKEPRASLLQTYAEMLRDGLPTAAAGYRKAVVDSIRSRSAVEAWRMDDWFEHAATFLRRVAELRTSVLRHAPDKLKPFAEAELARETEHGLTMLRDQAFAAPVGGTTASVLASAEAERARRIAEIDTFYQQALTGGTVVGLPPGKLRLTYWLRDGRLIFRELDRALAMAPRPEFVRHHSYWPTSIRKTRQFRYAPAQFHGPSPTSIEYVDPAHRPRFGVSSDEACKVIETDFSLDRDHARDRYRTGKGAWLAFPQMTTPELELRKVTGYARLHHAAEQAVGQT